MAEASNVNRLLVDKYKVDNTILKSYFRNSRGQNVSGMTFPLRLDNRQYCSPTDHQGDNPSCCGYSAAQILESMCWRRTGRIVQFDANQIYAKAKQIDGQMGKGGTFPDLAMAKGLELMPSDFPAHEVRTTSSSDVSELKRIIHESMFACVNMEVTKDIYGIDSRNFVYLGSDKKAGGHSMVCCGYDDESRMLILQNHWGVKWGLKGFFLCPYDVWRRQTGLTCWYQQVEAATRKSSCEDAADRGDSDDASPSDENARELVNRITTIST